MPATIGPGATGDDVKRLQRVLARQLLWNPFGPITGVFDASLEAAVKDFQQSSGLPADGDGADATDDARVRPDPGRGKRSSASAPSTGGF